MPTVCLNHNTIAYLSAQESHTVSAVLSAIITGIIETVRNAQNLELDFGVAVLRVVDRLVETKWRGVSSETGTLKPAQGGKAAFVDPQPKVHRCSQTHLFRRIGREGVWFISLDWQDGALTFTCYRLVTIGVPPGHAPAAVLRRLPLEAEGLLDGSQCRSARGDCTVDSALDRPGVPADR